MEMLQVQIPVVETSDFLEQAEKDRYGQMLRSQWQDLFQVLETQRNLGLKLNALDTQVRSRQLGTNCPASGYLIPGVRG